MLTSWLLKYRAFVLFCVITLIVFRGNRPEYYAKKRLYVCKEKHLWWTLFELNCWLRVCSFTEKSLHQTGFTQSFLKTSEKLICGTVMKYLSVLVFALVAAANWNITIISRSSIQKLDLQNLNIKFIIADKRRLFAWNFTTWCKIWLFGISISFEILLVAR